MKMTTRVAFDNMKYHKSRNILIGIAIILTTMLLFVVPTVGKGMIDLQFAATNRLYPAWHALYRNVDEDTVRKLAAHHDISRYGLRSDAGYMNLEEASVAMLYADREAMELYKMELDRGNVPEKGDEIVVSKGILEELGQQGDIGDTVKVPYQIFRGGELDLTQQKEFRICGFLKDSKASRKMRTYVALISEDFLRNEIVEEEIAFRFLLQIDDAGNPTTVEIEQKIQDIAVRFGIPENDININQDYLVANYLDPIFIPAIIVIMAIIMLAGVITIYSIYYVSMNHRIQEFGRMKAIGATKRQIRQIVLREGMCIAAFAVPAGLLAGTLVSGKVLRMFANTNKSDDEIIKMIKEILESGEINIYTWWVYLLAAAVTVCTVYFSLVRPMHVAAKISEVEAMRMRDAGGKSKNRRKGYEYLTIGRLVCRNLAENKKKSVITVLAMAVTGVFLMVVATVLSCADPRESAEGSVVGQYEICSVIEENNKEHPERKWSEVQKDNPLNEALVNQVEELPGVEGVDVFSALHVSGELFMEGDMNSLNGIPEKYADELEKNIVKGKATYEELKSGDKIIVDRGLLFFYPDLDVGDRLNLTVHDGDRTFEKEFEIAAIGEYRSGLTNYAYLIMAKEAVDQMSEYNSSKSFHVFGEKDYDPKLHEALKEIVDASGRIELTTWKEHYESWKSSQTVTSAACYIFLGILAVISVMNLVNTMINSVRVRKKELGMIQAIGMSDSQLMKMLQLEGLFYTMGTLLISVGIGSLAGYPVFLYAKSQGLFEIRTYHYPVRAAVAVAAALLLVQFLLAAGIALSVRKDSIIERIRFSD